MKETLKLPAIGLQTINLNAGQIKAGVNNALTTGYKLIEISTENEQLMQIKEILEASSVTDYYLMLKVPATIRTYEEVLKIITSTCELLNLSQLDVCLMEATEDYQANYEVWRGLETLYEQNKIKAIGGCDFTINCLDELLEVAKIAPMINQVTLNPNKQQFALHEYCWNFDIALMAKNIEIEANNPVLVKMANKHGKTEQQIILRWLMQRGIFTVINATEEEELKQALNVRDFNLSNIEMDKIADLDQES